MQVKVEQEGADAPAASSTVGPVVEVDAEGQSPVAQLTQEVKEEPEEEGPGEWQVNTDAKPDEEMPQAASSSATPADGVMEEPAPELEARGSEAASSAQAPGAGPKEEAKTSGAHREEDVEWPREPAEEEAPQEQEPGAEASALEELRAWPPGSYVGVLLATLKQEVDTPLHELLVRELDGMGPKIGPDHPLLQKLLKQIADGDLPFTKRQAFLVVKSIHHKRRKLLQQCVELAIGAREEAETDWLQKWGNAEQVEELAENWYFQYPAGSWLCKRCAKPSAPDCSNCQNPDCDGTQATTWGGYAKPPTLKCRMDPPSHRRCGSRKPTEAKHRQRRAAQERICLLYTSDAADEH